MLDWEPDSVAAMLPALDIAQWLVAIQELNSMISPAVAAGIDIYKSLTKCRISRRDPARLGTILA